MNSIALDGVTKTFDSGFSALDGVSLAFSRGELHAILGENGAGKSTLMHALSGLIEPTSGSILVDGRAVRFSSPADALALGVAMVHQRPLLSDSLSVAENVVVGSGVPFVDRNAIRDGIGRLAERWDMDPSRFRTTAALTPQDRFRVALLGALWRNPRFLVLDEPTAVFSAPERERFMECLVRATREGLGAIMITHRLDEALRWSDRVSVLRHGALVHSGPVTQATAAELAPFFSARVAPDAPMIATGESAARAPLSFSAQGLSASFANRPWLRNISFRAEGGEITGVFGLPGNGIDVLEDILTGMLPAATGTVSFERTRAAPHSAVALTAAEITPRALRSAGVGLVPSDRAFRASNPELSLRDVLTCNRALSVRDADAFAQRLLRSEDIDASPSRLASSLSGGQLQRLILARELAEHPAVLILAEPEWGLDVASVARFRERITCLAREGTAVIVLTDSPDTMKENGFFSRAYRLADGVVS